MKSYQWMTPVVVALAVVISPAWAKKGGNGGGGGGGGGEEPTVPNAAGEIVFSDAVGSIEVKIDGTNEQPTLAPPDADPSNLSFTGGARWYLALLPSGTFDQYENGEYVGPVQWQDVFAVNSLTGEEIQITDLAADGLYVYEAKWSRDGMDSYLCLTVTDVTSAVVIVDGELVFDTTNYVQVQPLFFTSDVSALEIEAASATSQTFTPASGADLLLVDHLVPPSVELNDSIREFTISPDGSLGVYEVTDFIYRDLVVLDVATGAVVEFLEGGRDPSWSPDGSKLVFATRETVEVYDVDTKQISVLQSESKREQSNFWNPEFSPDGNYILYSSQHPEGKNISFEAQVMNADGSQRVEVESRFRETARWVAD